MGKDVPGSLPARWPARLGQRAWAIGRRRPREKWAHSHPASQLASSQLWPVPSIAGPDLGDVLLHETAASWLRAKMRAAAPDVLPWEETQEMWAARARKVLHDINSSCDVHGLCLEFPSRLQELLDREGDRLRK